MLIAGTVTPLEPPAQPNVTFVAMAIANISAGDDLQLAPYLVADAIPSAAYLTIKEDTQRQIVPWQPGAGVFRRGSIGGYLLSSSGGVVEVIWS